LTCNFEDNTCGWTMQNFQRYRYESKFRPNSGPESAQNGGIMFLNSYRSHKIIYKSKENYFTRMSNYNNKL